MNTLTNKQDSKVYLDNAATTPVDPRVIDAMSDCLRNTYGNPSATHSLGRNAKGVLENSRKLIASYIGAESREIIFTSGGTEADNLAIRCAVKDLGIQHIITTAIEHKAVLSTSKELSKDERVFIHLVDIDSDGRINYDHLATLAASFPGALISIMHANNEIGTLVDPQRISTISKANKCLFHSDTVQTMCHYPIDVRTFGADFLACSAHKFNGPKGVGFLYMNRDIKINGLNTGGGQERGMRPGTENVAGITGLQKAMEISVKEMDEEFQRISGLKQSMKSALTKVVPGIIFNGDTSIDGGLYTVLSCTLPPSENDSLLLFQMDMAGVCVSGGSACNSGASSGSHVLAGIGNPQNGPTFRFSFGRFTTQSDIDFAVHALADLLNKPQVVA